MSSGTNAVRGLVRCKHKIFLIHCEPCKLEIAEQQKKQKEEPNKCTVDIKPTQDPSA